MRNYRLNYKIKYWLIVQGDFNINKYSNRLCLLDSINSKKYRNDSYVRAVQSYPAAFRKLLKHGVPVWFLKRYVRYISKHCIWERTGINYVEPSYTEKEYFSYLENDIASTRLFFSSSLPFVGKDGIENVSFDASYKTGVLVDKIIDFWEIMKNRYLSIYGLDCKMCKKHKKNKNPICYQFSKYSTKICADCLKGFCKLEEELRISTIKGLTWAIKN